MWERAKALPYGRLSLRNLCMFAAAMFVATFMYTVLASPTVHAADAEWSGDTITYFGNTYTKIAPAKAGDSHNLPAGSLIYRYVAPNTSNPGSPTTKADLIYFAPGTDPTKETSATFVTYDYTPPDKYKNPFGQTAIGLSPQNPVSAGTTSCAVEGIGWIVCPVANFLASAMDHLFGILASFLTVRPAQTNQETALYRAWSYMRNFANIAFVIAFLIIIYSQITTIGLSNYDIKKMLPRLIIAAILVNISYWICAIAIDISNIAGYSIQDIFISIRNNLVGSEGNSWDVFSWKSVAGLVLSGGTAAAAAGFGAYGLLLSAGAVSSALYMLLPILVGVIVAVLVALLVMAARQAIITILFIVSPLAFVAYLLPNTEQYFKKWHELGMTMLMLFPIFSFIFGGAQLAGMAIIQNADSFNLIILGMGVQVAPVVITPLLIKFSGSLVARIGGIVNNPGKGLIDRTRKFAEERRDQRKAAVFASPLNRRRDAVARLGRRTDTNKRTREGWQKANEATADANWASSKAYSDIQQRAMSADLIKNRGESDAQARFEGSKRTNAGIQNLELNARASKLKLDLSKADVEADWEEIKAGSATRIVTPDGLAADALRSHRANTDTFVGDIQNDAVLSEVAKSREHFGKHEQQQHYASALLASQELQTAAGGIAETMGSESALSSAIATQRKEYDDNIQNKVQLMKHFNLDSTSRQTLALGKDVPAEKNGVRYVFRNDDAFAREAAIQEQLKTGSFDEIETIIKESGKTLLDPATGAIRAGKTSAYGTSIASVIQANGIPSKAIYLGSKSIDQVAQGTFAGEAGIDSAIRYNISAGKVKDEVLAGMDAQAIKRMITVATTQEMLVAPADLPNFLLNRRELQHSAYRILNTDILGQRATTAAKEALQGFAAPPPTP
ncbi:MAG: rane protein of unknown function [Candidatus Saccharibacteria bacterium]|nr:rane protein of unknown function [Candidatus Saccharibacteria bacterium]